jgi:DNA polymerase-3 subunit epsilon
MSEGITVGFMDLETTGKRDPAHRIIEVSIRVHDLESRIEKRNYLQRFNPERNIDAKAQAVHKITLDDLKDKPKIITELPTIIAILQECDLMVAHNGDWFDFPFLRQEVERNGLVMPELATFDTMTEGTFATDLGKNPTLKELCYALDVDYDESKAHAGDYDTAVTRDAFWNGLDGNWFNI